MIKINLFLHFQIDAGVMHIPPLRCFIYANQEFSAMGIRHVTLFPENGIDGWIGNHSLYYK